MAWKLLSNSTGVSSDLQLSESLESKKVQLAIFLEDDISTLSMDLPDTPNSHTHAVLDVDASVDDLDVGVGVGSSDVELLRG